jgi:hypothetical protein
VVGFRAMKATKSTAVGILDVLVPHGAQPLAIVASRVPLVGIYAKLN